MRLTRSLSMALGSLLLTAGLFAQSTGVVSGTVTSSGSPLRGVTVTLSGSDIVPRTTITDSLGNYSFRGLSGGSYSVTFELAGLRTITRSAQVTPGDTIDVDADLQVATPGTPGYAAEVTVTGTLIPRPTVEAMSPVATLEVEELRHQGATRVEDFLTSMPQIFAAQNSTISNGASGTATVDLRGLGANRTLVLIDGKRMPSGDRFAIAPDLNFIPAALVKRVDILTGGASTVYGADAVAGVVNFVLDTDFQGLRGGVFGGIFQHNNDNEVARRINSARGFSLPQGSVWDGHQFEAYLAYGGRFGEEKGHAAAYIDYRSNAALRKDRRDYTNCSVQNLVAAGAACGGSSTSAFGRFFTDDGGDYALGPGNTLVPFSAEHLYNFAVHNFMQRPDERWSAGGFMNYSWNRYANGYASFMLMDDTTDAQIAPSGNFFATDRINCNNPMLTPDQVQKICTNAGYGPDDMAGLVIGRRNVEGGNRVDLLNHQAYRLVTGLRGDINDAWTYDVYGLHGQTRVPEQYLNDLNTERLQDALIVDGDRNDPSTWRCRSGNLGCVPWNIFQAGGVTEAALDYLRVPLVSNTDLTTQVVAATASGDLGRYGLAFPSAAEGVSIAVGAGYSKYSLEYVTDLAYQLQLGAGQGGPQHPIFGKYDVNELYAEFLVPIIQGAPGARDLSLELGYRTSDYSTTGRHPTYKAQLSYAPTRDFKIRGGYNRATRSPNIVELFEPQGLGLGGAQDPCAGDNPSYTVEQCQRTGVSPAQYGSILSNPAGQYNTLEGGNPALQPEIADTMTFGVVLTPAALPTFSLTLDYYDIKVEDTIGSLAADQIIATCAETGNPALCGLIHRDSRGTLWLTPDGYTVSSNVNIGELRAEGIDANLSYLHALAGSSLTFNLIGTYMLSAFANTGLFEFDCVGFMGNRCGATWTQPIPKWQHYSRFGWERGRMGASLAWRMVGPVTVDAASDFAALSDPANIPRYQAAGSFEHSAFNYLDLSARYDVGRNLRFTIGVNNLFDKEPPLGAGFSDVDFGPGFYNFYDSYGRYIHTSLTFTIQ